VKRFATGSIDQRGLHGLALRASVARAFELAAWSWSTAAKHSPFFGTATLRGVCEDLIVFSFLRDIEPKIRDRLVELQMAAQVAEGLAAQVEFFAKMRPWQAVVGPAKDRGNTEVEELRTLTRSLGWNGSNEALPRPDLAGQSARATGQRASKSII